MPSFRQFHHSFCLSVIFSQEFLLLLKLFEKIAHCTTGNNFGILEHGSVYLISIQAVLNFYDKNNKSLIKHVYL